MLGIARTMLSQMSVCLSIRLSVTYDGIVSKHILKLFSPPCSHTIQVFPYST